VELNITRFFREANPFEYSASQAELGERAASITWNAAVAAVDEYPLLDTDDKREAFKAFVKGFGAWTWDEINSWNNAELNALCLQFIAGDMREAQLDVEEPDWAEYERRAQAGNISGRIFKGDDDEVYIYIGD
jgi:hypothetical protein